ncbi:voltage-gated chloride channel protein, partial [Klebsiella pneumoniae]
MTVARYLLKWSLLGAWVGVLGGIASAGFLLALDWATQRRVDTPSLLFFLPLAGAAIGLLYDRVGKDVAG